MTLTITLNTEQQSAADDLLAEYNATQDVPIVLKEYLETVVIGIINDKVAKNFETTANALVVSAKSLSYEARLALIAQVQSQLQP